MSKFFSEEAVYCLTAMSERALANTEADLRHRFLVKCAVIALTKLAGTADRHQDTAALVLNRQDGRRGPYTSLTGLEPDATLQFPHQTSREPLSEQVLE